MDTDTQILEAAIERAVRQLRERPLNPMAAVITLTEALQKIEKKGK